jgi:hypothetical protein
VASSCRLLDSNIKKNPTPLTRHTRINHPAFTLPNFSQPNQETPRSSLERTTLNQVKKHLQGPSVTQVAAFCRRACPLERLDLRSQEWGPKFVTVMWEHSLWIWQFRNDAFLADTNSQVKNYKLEELEGKKHASHSDTHNLNHYFISSNRNISIHQIWSTDYDTIVKSAGQLSPNSFLIKLNLDSHPALYRVGN